MAAGEIELALNKLNKLVSVLYVAAHPDDENTRLISWLANGELARTGYLSLTRGDGGQNLIGIEKGALMGVLRTQELLEARKVDNGEQMFSRAVDFGYSKTPEETVEIWDREQVLADAVWAIRKFKPDVMITRFMASGGGHGHHTASARLANEAFKLAGDKKAFPEQLKFVGTWQPTKIFVNTSTWWDKSLPEKAKESDEYVIVDVGNYNSWLGKSYTEVAAESRSMHKSQGFGATGSRGQKLEYLKLVDGNHKPRDLFSNIDPTWNRVPNSGPVSEKIAAILENFDSSSPHKSVPALVDLRKTMLVMDKHFWIDQKIKEVEKLILACAGIWVDALSDQHTYALGDSIKIETSALVRAPISASIEKIVVADNATIIDNTLEANIAVEKEIAIKGPAVSSNPYWLNASYTGMFQVNDQELIGLPENKPAVTAEFHLIIDGEKMVIQEPVRYRWNDRVQGELYRPLSIVPPVTITPTQKVYITSSEEGTEIALSARSFGNFERAVITMKADENWEIVSPTISPDFSEPGQERIVRFKIKPRKNATASQVSFSVNVDGKDYTDSYVEIEHDHIQTQTILGKSEAKVAYIPAKYKAARIGYIMGAGDEVPDVLKGLGFTVTQLDPATLAQQDLSQFDAIVSGIRAYNTEKVLAQSNTALIEYVEKGGTYIVQYNTNRGLATDKIGPYDFNISRKRVTLETAAPTILEKKHALFNTPFEITDADFNNWVQERGLYFADAWADEFTPMISWNDPGEDPQKGSLLVAKHGKGIFIYTGISFFRQLPAGVPGAIKLFVNILSAKQ